MAPASGAGIAAAAAAIAVAAGLAAAGLGPLLRRCWRLPQQLVVAEEKASDALCIGLLGASTIGRAAAVFAAGKRRDAIVAVVASRDRARAEAFARSNGIPVALGGPGAYDELLGREDVEAVYISLPTPLHLRWATAALAAGKHVLLEKPAVLNAQEAAELKEAAERSGRVLMEAAHWRHHPAARRARELLRGLGELRRLEARLVMTDPKAWLTTALGRVEAQGRERTHERVKNLDRWWYCADELLWMSGATSWEVLSAEEGRFSMTASLRVTLPVAGHQHVVNATMHMARDRLMPPFDWSFRAEGSDGALTFSNVGFPFLFHSIAVEKAGQSRQEERLYGAGETTFEHQLAAFVAAVRRGGGGSGRRVAEGEEVPAEPASAEQAFSTLALVDAVLRAAGSPRLASGLR